MTVLIIDHVDSFVYTLAHYVADFGHAVRVVRHMDLAIEDITAMAPTHLILSPGPKLPQDVQGSINLVKQLVGHMPILGVCLGHQIIGAAFGAKIARARCPMHGKSADISHDGQHILSGLPQPLRVGRYHSMVVSDEGLSAEMVVTARCQEQDIMALAHCHFAVYGVQFHPESILTDQGKQIMRNFLANIQPMFNHGGDV